MVLQICAMNWSDLRAFLAVAQAGSLRQAAEALGVSQPTISRHLGSLERDLGLPLFERGREGHRLTPAGAELLPEIRTVESAVLRVEQRALGLLSDLAETVRIGAGETAAAVLARGLGQVPGETRIELLVDGGPLPVREPDIRLQHGMPTEGGDLIRRVGSVRSAVYGVPEFAEGRSLPLSDADLATLPWLGFVEEQEHYVTMRWLRARLRDRPPMARLMSSDLLAVAAQTGQGVAVLPCFLGDERPGLLRLSAPIEDLQADYWIRINPELARNSTIRSASNWILGCFRMLETSTAPLRAKRDKSSRRHLTQTPSP